MLPNQQGCRLRHATSVEGQMEPTNLGCGNRRPHRTVEQLIPVGASQCAEAGVKLVGHWMGPQDRNALRQQRIDAAYPCGCRSLRVRIEVDDLRPGMHAAVGPARASHVDDLAGDLAKRGFKCILHSAAAGLRLPAEKAATVVLES